MNTSTTRSPFCPLCRRAMRLCDVGGQEGFVCDNCPGGRGAVVSRARHIAYVCTLDGWGHGEPTQEDRESFCALVEARLAQWYPGRTVEAYVDDQALDSRVMTDDETIDEAELCSTIGTSVWDDWCGGERASAPSVPHVARAVLP